jgi:hypothetical protein
MSNQAAGRPCGDKCIDPARCDKATGGCVSGVGQTYTISTGGFRAAEIWAPTMELRYIRRQVKPGWFETTLQQRWIRQSGGDMSLGGIQWRDLPIVTENEG